MDEHDKRAREVVEGWAGLTPSLERAIASALRSTAAAAVAAERERQEREAGPRLLAAVRRTGDRHSAWIRRRLGEDAARQFDEYRGETISLAAPAEQPTYESVAPWICEGGEPMAPAQAEQRVSEAGKHDVDTFNLGLRTGAGLALITERSRIAARLRARAESERRKADIATARGDHSTAMMFENAAIVLSDEARRLDSADALEQKP